MAKKVRTKRNPSATPDPFNDGSLTDRAYQQIKEEILTNRLRPGDPLHVDHFVRSLGLSRTPLREAIQELEKEGLVEIRPRMGSFVSHIELREIVEMYQVRALLEGFAARLAAGRVSPDRLVEVEEELTRQPLGSETDYAVLSKAGLALHRLIVESCGNLVLTRFVVSLQDHFRRFRAVSPQLPERVVDFHQEHLQILDALKKGDGARAQQLTQRHLERAAELLMERLLGQPVQAAATPMIVRPAPALPGPQQKTNGERADRTLRSG
ncbi:MAG: GntR family transcriptional regulator [Acidobacteria bacterium]|nr:MAG: GntR family transcriptional regulator [Acidobacteriota bacterium]